MKKEVNWDKIPLSHDALFGQVMRDPTLCKTMLEKLLGVSIVLLIPLGMGNIAILLIV